MSNNLPQSSPELITPEIEITEEEKTPITNENLQNQTEEFYRGIYGMMLLTVAGFKYDKNKDKLGFGP